MKQGKSSGDVCPHCYRTLPLVHNGTCTFNGCGKKLSEPPKPLQKKEKRRLVLMRTTVFDGASLNTLYPAPLHEYERILGSALKRWT